MNAEEFPPLWWIPRFTCIGIWDWIAGIGLWLSSLVAASVKRLSLRVYRKRRGLREGAAQPSRKPDQKKMFLAKPQRSQRKVSRKTRCRGFAS